MIRRADVLHELELGAKEATSAIAIGRGGQITAESILATASAEVRVEEALPAGEPTPLGVPRTRDLEQAIADARVGLVEQQQQDGHWCYELEADCTIPAEYILMNHLMGEIEDDLEARIGIYLRKNQHEDGGWGLYHGHPFDLSCAVKCYYALKLIGDDPEAEHMARARQAILRHGGAARCNVFTRITLAFFNQLPWRGVPFVPVEIMMLPKWFPFHLSKVSYWSRTVMVPLAILCSLKIQAKNPRGVDVKELFVTPPERERRYFTVRSHLNRVFLSCERLVRHCEPLIPWAVRKKAIAAAEAWFVERLNGEDGLGGIFPAMVNAYVALHHLGYAPDHPLRKTCRDSIRKLLVDRGDDGVYCQPCFSPVWDTAIAAIALQEADRGTVRPETTKALDWLVTTQLDDEPGDWRDYRPNLRGGGWAFQYNNPHYPDLDDTAMAGWALGRAKQGERYQPAIDRAADWIVGMQSKNGGFAAFDADNTYYYLNAIPFADHGALLDPPTADVSGGCLRFLTLLDHRHHDDARQRCRRFLEKDQTRSGSWYGRWGTNYLYGTWATLLGLGEAGIDSRDPMVARAVAWVERMQRPDGGWGETNASYFEPRLAGRARTSTSFQTAWALLGLMAVGRYDSEAVRLGIDYLLRTQDSDGLWHDPGFTAPGFPRVFYLKYHGYDKLFPLWALARYRNLRQGIRI